MYAATPAPARLIAASLPDGTPVHVELGLVETTGPDITTGPVCRVRAIRPRDPHRDPSDDRHDYRDGAPNSADRLDLRGFVLLPTAAEPHAHLDKALSWAELDPPPGDLNGAIATWREGSPGLDEESFRRRALSAATAMLSNGITAVRTHVDVLPGVDRLRALRALVELRAALHGVMTVQIAVLASPRTPTADVERALDCGADLVGGAPHLADDPLAEVTRLLDLAEDRGIGADLHVDEFLDGDHLTIEAFAARVADWPADRVRTASHCSRLSTLAPADLDRVAAALARGSVSVVALPITNLYLQGQHGPSAGRRGITTIDALRDAGVLVAAGADNVRDPFNPMGRADPFETASLLVTAAHQRPGAALDLVTHAARGVLGLESAGPRVGARADFLAVRATDYVEAIAAAPPDRVVIVGGVVVARTETTRWTAVASERPLSVDLPVEVP